MTTIVQLGSCTIPAGLLQAGDRLAIRATWSHGGITGDVLSRLRWGTSVAAGYTSNLTAAVAETQAEVALHTGGAIVSSSHAAAGAAMSTKLESLSGPYSTGLTIGFEGNPLANGDSLGLLQFTVIRYPAQSNP